MNSSTTVLLETVNFAAEKHRSQRRKDVEGTPYINHPIGLSCAVSLSLLHVLFNVLLCDIMDMPSA